MSGPAGGMSGPRSALAARWCYYITHGHALSHAAVEHLNA